MKIHTYGKSEDPVVLLLHPMLVSGAQMAEHLGKRLSGGFYLISPDQGAHGEAGGEFVSAKQEAAELHRWLLTQGIREIALLFGASLGGVTAMELLKLGKLHYRSVHLDGVPLAPLGGVQAMMAPTIYLGAWKEARRNPAESAGMLSRMYGVELGKSMAEQLGAMNESSVRRILNACLSGCAAPLEAGMYDRMTLEWGEKDVSLRKGRPLAEKLYPQAKIIVRPGLGHCEYLGREPEAYARELDAELAE